MPRISFGGAPTFDGLVVSVSLRGHCVGCPASQATVQGTVQGILREKVDPEIVVREA